MTDNHWETDRSMTDLAGQAEIPAVTRLIELVNDLEVTLLHAKAAMPNARP